MERLRKRRLLYTTRKYFKDFADRDIPYFTRSGELIILNKSHTYRPAIPQIVQALFAKDIQEARKRVSVSGGYRYIPSKAYLRTIGKMFKNRTL